MLQCGWILENIILSEIRQVQKIYCIIQFIGKSRTGNPINTESGLVVLQGWGVGWEGKEQATNGSKFRGWWKCSKIDGGDGYTALGIL